MRLTVVTPFLRQWSVLIKAGLLVVSAAVLLASLLSLDTAHSDGGRQVPAQPTLKKLSQKSPPP